METYAGYFKMRETAILRLLGKPRKKYTSETFHQLRVEIKKLNAFFELIQFCAADFERKKTFKPFKRIFSYAGKVRELQVEEEILKKYLLKNRLSEYRKKLNDLILIQTKNYFSAANKTLIKQLKKKFDIAEAFLVQMDKKELKRYLDKRAKKVEKILTQKKLRTSELHQLRKLLKKLHYNQKILGRNKQNKIVVRNNNLIQLLGKWNDCRVVTSHFKNIMKAGGIHPKELEKLEKANVEISSQADALLSKIAERSHVKLK